MDELTGFLYLSVACLIAAVVLMLALGHRVGRSGWIISGAAVVGFPLLGDQLLLQLFGLGSSELVIFAVIVFSLIPVFAFHRWNLVGQLTFAYAGQTAIAFFVYTNYHRNLPQDIRMRSA